MQGKERLETNTKKTNRNLKNVFKFFVFFSVWTNSKFHLNNCLILHDPFSWFSFNEESSDLNPVI